MTYRELQSQQTEERNPIFITKCGNVFSVLPGLHTRPELSLTDPTPTHTKCLQVKLLLPYSVAAYLQVQITACEPMGLLISHKPARCSELHSSGM